jgi:hypothetical protein
MYLLASAFNRKLRNNSRIKMMKIKGEDCGFNRMGLQFQKLTFTVVLTIFTSLPVKL